MELETFFSVSEQTAQFFLSVALGAGLGILYDVFRAVRIVFPFTKKFAAVLVGDTVFTLCAGAALFLFAVVFCRAEIRLFCIIGACLGFVLYIASLGNFIIGILRTIFSFLYTGLRKVYSLISAQFVKIAKGIYPKRK